MNYGFKLRIPYCHPIAQAVSEYTNLAKCHSDRSEESLEFVGFMTFQRSFAMLRMTILFSLDIF